MDLRVSYEYRAAALRPQHLAASKLSSSAVEALILELEGIAEPVEIDWRHRPLSIDKDDDLVLDLAINGRADVIVTRNLRHLRDAAKPFGIAVEEPHIFLARTS